MHVIRRTLLYTVGLLDLQSLELSITIKTFALKFIITRLKPWPAASAFKMWDCSEHPLENIASCSRSVDIPASFFARAKLSHTAQ